MATIEVEPSQSEPGSNAATRSSTPLLTLQAQSSETSYMEETLITPHKQGGGKTTGPRSELPPYWQSRARTPSPSIDDNLSEAGSESTIHAHESLMQYEINASEPKFAFYYHESDESIEVHHEVGSESAIDSNDNLGQDYIKVSEPKLAFYNYKHDKHKGYDPRFFKKDRAMVANWLLNQPTHTHLEFVKFVANIKTAEAAQTKSEFEKIILLAGRLRAIRAVREVEDKLQQEHSKYEAALRQMAETDISAALALHLYLTERSEDPQRALLVEEKELVQRYQELCCRPIGDHEFMIPLLQDLSEAQAEMVFFGLRGYKYDPGCTGGISPELANSEFSDLLFDEPDVIEPELEQIYIPGVYIPELNIIGHLPPESDKPEQIQPDSNNQEPEALEPVKRGRGRPRKISPTGVRKTPAKSRVSKKSETTWDKITVLAPRAQKKPKASVKVRKLIKAKAPVKRKGPVKANAPIRPTFSTKRTKASQKLNIPSTTKFPENTDASIKSNPFARPRFAQRVDMSSSRQPPQPIQRDPQPSPHFSEEEYDEDEDPVIKKRKKVELWRLLS